MSKILTANQMLGEIGETAVRRRFLDMGFQFDGRSRLEAGIDGIAEVMLDGRPLAQMIAVQVKATEAAKYTAETDDGFSYLLRSKDLEYWRPSNLPVIIVLYPQALLSGKKRMDNSGSLRGQVIMWHRFLTQRERGADDLFAPEASDEPSLRFGEPPQITLDTRVPEDVWGTPKKKPEDSGEQERLAI